MERERSGGRGEEGRGDRGTTGRTGGEEGEGRGREDRKGRGRGGENLAPTVISKSRRLCIRPPAAMAGGWSEVGGGVAGVRLAEVAHLLCR